MQERRNGQEGIGPLKFEARKIVLNKLLDLQRLVNQPLISAAEVVEIEKIWEDDKSTGVMRKAQRLITLLEVH